MNQPQPPPPSDPPHPAVAELKKKRSVSWDADKEEEGIKSFPSDMDENVSVLSNSPDRRSLFAKQQRQQQQQQQQQQQRTDHVSMRMRDIVQNNPLEYEAETYIIKALESADPLNNHPNEAQLTILSNVPLDICHNFSVDNTGMRNSTKSTISGGGAGVSPRRPSTRIKPSSSADHATTAFVPTPTKSHYRSNTSTAEDLFNLTADVMKLQQLSQNNNGNTTPQGKNQHHPQSPTILIESGLGTSADVFANNAARLLHRQHGGHHGNLQTVSEQESLKVAADTTVETVVDKNEILRQSVTRQSTTKPPVSGTANWKKVRAAVNAARLANELAATTTKHSGSPGGTDEDPSMTNVDTTTKNPETTSIHDVEMGTNTNDALMNDSTRPGDSISSSMGRKKKHNKLQSATDQFKYGFLEFEDWVKFKKTSIITYIKILLYLILPATGLAAILFYVADNPPCGTYEECQALQAVRFNDTIRWNQTAVDNTDTLMALFQNFFDKNQTTSYSWWILFFVRHVLILSFAVVTQAIVIDFLCMRSRIALKLAGPTITLYTVQSKGWAFILTVWGIFSFCFLHGPSRFANNWMFWQNTIDMFNATNPSGGVTQAALYQRVLLLAISVGICVSIKRFWVGLFLGRQTFHRYATDLATLMRKVLLIGQVANLAKDIEYNGYKLSDITGVQYQHETLTKSINFEEDCNSEGGGGLYQENQPLLAVNTNDNFGAEQRVFGLQKDFTGSSTRIKIEKLLGAWEEPKEIRKSDEKISISSIIHFRTSLACLNTHVPFSSAFGVASSRQECVESSETVFRRLLLATPGEHRLSFDVIATLAVSDNGQLDEQKVKELIKLFRPDREGYLTVIDFVKSVDAVYKRLRLLRASVINNSRMDRAFERIIDFVFYFIVACIALSVVGIDPLVLFASISGFVLGFAFMIGSACSKYFEGLLLILVRRPYDIGDRIHIGDPNSEANTNGSSTWFVRDVSLFTTTACYAATNEVATFSNGSLANARIINSARSPEASISFLLKFPISASYEKLKIFRNALEEFVKARPREYLSFAGFRCTRIEADLGFAEYIVAVSHRESWQNLRSILSSKAELASFALELSKKMNLRFISPPMPVDLRMSQSTMAALGMETIHFNHPVPTDQDDDNENTENDIHEVRAIFDKH